MNLLAVSRLLKHFLALPISKPIAQKFAGRATAFMYHSVLPAGTTKVDPGAFSPNRTLYVSQDKFEEQIAYISKRYRCLDLKEALFELEHGSLPRGSAIITFDDGYYDTLSLAWPVLEKYRVPAAIFVTSSFIDGAATLWWEELQCAIGRARQIDVRFESARFAFSTATNVGKMRAYNAIANQMKSLDDSSISLLMNLIWEQIGNKSYEPPKMLSWSELKELDKHPLCTIGAHTVTHRSLSILSPDELKREIVECKTTLEAALGHPIYYFSYPYGGVSDAGPREFEAVKQAGYRAAFTTRFGHLHPEHRGHLYKLPRVDLSSEDDKITFDYKLSGVEAVVRGRFRRVITA